MTADDLLKSRDVAILFGVKVVTVNRWERKGLITCLRTPGGGKRYRRAEVEALRRHRAGHAAERV